MKYFRAASGAEAICGGTTVVYIQDCRGAAAIDADDRRIDLNPDDVLFIGANASATFSFSDAEGFAEGMMFAPANSLDAGNDASGAVIRITREAAPVLMKNGRKTHRLFGGGTALIKTSGLSGAFATFASRYGTMESHCHENEYMYVIDAKDVYVTYGPDKDHMTHRQTLHKGDILRPHDGEWHRFDYLSEDGFVDFCNLFAVGATHVINASDV